MKNSIKILLSVVLSLTSLTGLVFTNGLQSQRWLYELRCLVRGQGNVPYYCGGGSTSAGVWAIWERELANGDKARKIAADHMAANGGSFATVDNSGSLAQSVAPQEYNPVMGNSDYAGTWTGSDWQYSATLTFTEDMSSVVVSSRHINGNSRSEIIKIHQTEVGHFAGACNDGKALLINERTDGAVHAQIRDEFSLRLEKISGAATIKADISPAEVATTPTQAFKLEGVWHPRKYSGTLTYAPTGTPGKYSWRWLETSSNGAVSDLDSGEATLEGDTIRNKNGVFILSIISQDEMSLKFPNGQIVRYHRE